MAEVSLDGPRLLLAITPEDAARHKDVAERWIAGLSEGLAQSSEVLDRNRAQVILQLRDKRAEDRQLGTLLDRLRRDFPAFRVLLNGAAERARRLGFDGHHRPAAARSVRRETDETPEHLVGQSSHSLDEARRAVALGVDYVIFGPVFDTPSKRGFGPPQGLRRLRRVCESLPVPIVAVGGIDGDTACDALRCGAAGVAAIRAAGDSAQVGRMLEALARFASEP